MSEFKNFFIDKNDVDDLKNLIIGKTCNNACEGKGVIVKNHMFIDCTCSKEFQNNIQLLLANIPKKYWDFTLRNLTKEFSASNTEPLALFQRFREEITLMIREGVGLYVYGAVGLAKSALSYYTLKYAMTKGIVCYSIRMSQLTKLIFDSLKENKYRDQLDWIKHDVQLLMIDEVDKDYNIRNLNQFAGVQVNDFFGMLYEQKKSLIVTANVPRDGLKSVHADNVIDRFGELVDVAITGGSYRKSAGALKRLIGNG